MNVEELLSNLNVLGFIRMACTGPPPIPGVEITSCATNMKEANSTQSS